MNLGRFPSHAKCRRQVDRASQHLEYIDGHILLFAYDRENWREYREQVVAWRGLWFDLSVCQTPPTIADDVCRMRRIRQAIGEENYAAGRMPPPIASYLLANDP